MSGHREAQLPSPFGADSVAKVFLSHRSQILRAVGRGERILMWGTNSSCDELTGDFGGAFETTSIDDCRLFCGLAEN
jgi:hypothetical protein